VLNALENTTNLYSFARVVTFAAPELKSVPSPYCASASVVQEISLGELEQWLIEKDAVYLVDVREQHEYENYNIGGVNIPLTSLPEQLHTLPENESILFCCLSGKRSLYAATLLARSQFKGRICNLKEGLSSFS
jgi:adenylyltransferase/sulfurtransferase